MNEAAGREFSGEWGTDPRRIHWVTAESFVVLGFSRGAS